MFVPVIYTHKNKEHVLIFDFKELEELKDQFKFLPMLRQAVKPSGDATLGVLPPDYSLDGELFEKYFVDLKGVRTPTGEHLTKDEAKLFVNNTPQLRRNALAALFTNFVVKTEQVADCEELVIDVVGRDQEEITGEYRVYNPEAKTTSVERATFAMSVPSEQDRLDYFSKTYGEVNTKEKSWKRVDDYEFLNKMFDKLLVVSTITKPTVYQKAEVLEELFSRVNLKNE